jgi:hypothetical protein
MSICSCDDSFDYSFSNGDGKTVINISDETGRLRLETRGEITFTDDETAVKSISDEGYIKFKKNGNKLKAEPNGAGEIVYTINDGPRVTQLNDNEKKLLARAIKEMINVGFDAKNREERIYNRGGSTAVLGAIDDLHSDYVKALYFEYLITDGRLTQDEMAAVTRKIGLDVNSDYEKSRLLQKMPVSFFDNEQVCNAYLDAAGTLNSDYEKDNALKVIVDQPLTPQQYNQALNVINNISSDYDKANVLKQLISHGTPSDNNTNTFLNVTNSIGSDYEKANVLKELLAHGLPVGVSYIKFLDVAGGVSSDYEKGGVLKKMASANITNEDQWVSLIKETEKINGDYERSDAMIEIAKWMPKSEKVKSAYMLTAKTITSEYDYGQAVKAIN